MKVTYGRRGVSADHPLAVAAGLKVLENGGNAFDASIAVSAVLSVVHPFSGGLGGDGFILALSDNQIIAYNGSGKSPSGFDAEEYMAKKPLRGPLTVTIPGLVEMWGYIVEEHGSMDLRDLLKPAISLADNGFHADRALGAAVSRYRGELEAFEGWRKLYGGVETGSLVKNRGLASVMKRISSRGWDEFYYGRVAEDLVSGLEKQGVGISLEDLMDHEGLEVEPLKLDLGSRVLYELPPNSQGISTLQMISALHELEIDKYGFNDLRRIDAWSEPTRRIYTFRDRNLGDPEAMTIDPRGYVNYSSIKSETTGSGMLSDGDTTFFVVDDGENLVGFIQSLFHPFGSGVTALGIVMQNRGSGFSYEKGLPNTPSPRKRPLHTLSILMIDDHERNSTYMIGCAGGDYRPQIHTRIYENIFVYKMDLGEALAAPRFIYTDLSKGSRVIVEEGLGEYRSSLGVEVQVIKGQRSTGLVNAARRDRARGYTEFAPDTRGTAISIAI
ncbi:MAG TPA: gamma-glutamyltransferase [Sulfolobales archaeon]|nr:gamma-glutamyltransferase [Sulfolobales archaeon]